MQLANYAVREPGSFARPQRPFTRMALAAAHVVADPLSEKEPWLSAAIDWDATIAFRRTRDSTVRAPPSRSPTPTGS